MRLCFIGSGVEREDTFLDGIDITNVVRLCREQFDTLVFGGSSVGLIGLFAAEFHATGGAVVSVVPGWLADAGLVFEHGEVIQCESLAQRKEILFASIDALLCYPGGVGTCDELFDHLARQAVSASADKVDVYLYDYDMFFAPLLLQLETAVECGLIAQAVVDAVRVFDSPQALSELFKSRA